MNNYLDELEAESIYIIREAYKKLDNLCMLWSIGKDSNTMLWLARKAFFGNIPFPLLHIDTSFKIPEMIKFRDEFAKKWNLNLIIGQNKTALEQGMNHQKGRVICCSALKTEGLKQTLEQYNLKAVFAGIRRDEEGTRAKERVFSPRNDRDSEVKWDVKNQPPEFWNQYKTDFKTGTSIRIHPLLHWNELDIWRYIEREKIPVVSLYFAGENGLRYRSLGCAPCTFPVKSNAKTVPEIIRELETTNISERAGRSQDAESEGAFEKLRQEGYM